MMWCIGPNYNKALLRVKISLRKKGFKILERLVIITWLIWLQICVPGLIDFFGYPVMKVVGGGQGDFLFLMIHDPKQYNW